LFTFETIGINHKNITMADNKDLTEIPSTKPNWGQRFKAKKYWWHKYFINPFIFIPFVVITFIICFYPFHFIRGKISYKNEDWVGFSAYLQMIFSFVNIILFAAIATTTYEYSKTSDVKRMIDDRRAQMPVISFSRNKANHFYKIRNLGKGGAFNIRLKTHFLKSKDKWQHCKIIHNMPSDTITHELDFTTNCNMLCATYEDLFGHKYITIMENDTLLIIDNLEPQHLEWYAYHIKKVNKECLYKPEYIDNEI
jgi:hypothetical protein